MIDAHEMLPYGYRREFRLSSSPLKSVTRTQDMHAKPRGRLDLAGLCGLYVCVTSIENHDRAAAEHLKGVARDQHCRRLVDADTRIFRIIQHCGKEPRETLALDEMLISDHLGPESEPVAELCAAAANRRQIGGLAADNHQLRHGGSSRARPTDQSPGGMAFTYCVHDGG